MTDIDKPQDPHRLRDNIFIIAGTVVVIATYLYLIIAQPAVVDENFALNGTGAVTNMRLDGGSNFAAAAGSCLTLRHNGVQWYEVGRSA